MATPFLDAALDAAASGLPVFRCKPGQKQPAFRGWQDEATTDPRMIREMWGDIPYNIGCSTRGLVVLDVDVKTGRSGDSELECLLDLFGDLPATSIAETPSGGTHYYFHQPEGAAFGNHTPFKGIDIRADGGFTLLPGSVIAGKPYAWKVRGDIPPVPNWIEARLKAAPKKQERQDNIEVLPASPNQIERAARYLSNEAEPAVAGMRGNDTTYKTATKLRDMIGPEHQALDLMIEHYNPRCDPPWSYDELRTITANAYRYAANAAPGGLNPENDFTPVETSHGPQFIRPNMIRPQARRWQIRNVSAPGIVHVLTAPPGAGKTTLSIQIGVAATTGDGRIINKEIVRPCRTWLYNAEDPRDELYLRLRAVMQHFKVADDRLLAGDGTPLLAINSGLTGDAFNLMRRAEDGTLTRGDANKIIKSLKRHRIGLIILDPMVDMHDGQENDNVEMSRVMTEIQRIAVEADCAVILIHHSRKVIDRESASGNMEVTRGAQAIVGKARAVTTLFQMGERQTRDFRDGNKVLEPGDETRYVAWTDAKGNMSLAGSTNWFRRTSVDVAVQMPAEPEGGAYRQPAAMEDTEGQRHDWEAVGVLEPVALTRLAGETADGGKVDAGVIAGDLMHALRHADPIAGKRHMNLKDAIASCLIAEDSAETGRPGCAARWSNLVGENEHLKFVGRVLERISTACGTHIVGRPIPVPGSETFILIEQNHRRPYRVHLLVEETDSPHDVDGDADSKNGGNQPVFRQSTRL